MVYLGCISRYSPLLQVEERILEHQHPLPPPPEEHADENKTGRSLFCLYCPNSSGAAAATNHIKLLPQDPPFLQRGGGLCDNRVLQGHHRLTQPKGRKHAQYERTR